MIENIIIYNFYIKSILYKLLYESKTEIVERFNFSFFIKILEGLVVEVSNYNKTLLK